MPENGENSTPSQVSIAFNHMIFIMLQVSPDF